MKKSIIPPGDEFKTFFSQWGPPTLLFGLFAAFGTGVFLITVFYPQKEPAYAILILPALMAVFWLIFFRRVRFEYDRVLFFYCGFFPVRMDYADITGMEYFFMDSRHPDAPTMLVFHLNFSQTLCWNINLFVPEVRLKIMREMEKRIRLPEHRQGKPVFQQEIPDFQQWLNHATRTSRTTKSIYGLFAVFTLICGFCCMCSQFVWNDRIRDWDKVDGIILRNTEKWAGNGKHRKKVADVEYRYLYKGKPYTGTRIVYDSGSFPDLKPGTRRQVIVNPANPQDCAVMFWYVGHWKWMRYRHCAFFYLISLWMFVLFFRSFRSGKTVVPERLKKYTALFTAEQFSAAWNLDRHTAGLCGVEMRSPMEYQQNGRYGIICQRKSITEHIIFGALLILAAAASFVIPICWLGVVFLGFVFYSGFVRRMTVFDFQEQKFCCRCKSRWEKSGKNESVPFSEIDHFRLSASYTERDKKYIQLHAVKRDGRNVPVCGVRVKHLALLLELLPELAEKTGHLPITYF